MTEPLLAASNVSVSLGGTEILTEVDLTAQRGELVGLVGPNGAGKTTVLRTLRSSLEPDEGVIKVDGDRLAELSAKAVSRRVASTPQETTLSFEFTVERTVEMGRTPHLGRFDRVSSADREAVTAAMERVDVAQFADRSITSLSGGERQRVLLARALAQSTPVLLLDEPTASLDINHAIRTLELVGELVAAGKTAVAAIHDLNLAARYCDKLVLLADGRVRAAGDPHDVLTSDTLRDAFDAETLVTSHPDGDTPLVTPLPEREPIDRTVHIVGTGRQAGAAVARLVHSGVDVSLGVVPAGDAAAERARELNCPLVTVPPFAGIDAAARDSAIQLAQRADVVVVAGDLGDGNQPVVTAAPRVIAIEGEGVQAVKSGRTTTTTIDALPETVATLSDADRPVTQ